MRYLMLILLPGLLWAQELRFELQPEAFPVEISAWQPYCPWAGGWDNSTPEFCDLDGDGDLDFFSGSSTNYYWYFENVGTLIAPDFNSITSCFDSLLPVIIGESYNSTIRFGDLDGDGDQDAIISNGIPEVKENLGTPQQWNFTGPLDTLRDQYGNFVFGIYFDLVDIDADGDLDIMGGFQDPLEPGIRFYQNVGTTQQYDFHLITTAWQGIAVAGSNQNPCFGDLDADGDLDLLIGTGAGTVYYYRNDGDSATAQMTYVTNNYCNIDVEEDASPELADIDGDGDLDLFVGRAPNYDWSTVQGDVFFYENVGTPQEADFQFVTSNYLTWDCGYSATPRLVDIDGDELPDLLSHIGSRLLFYRNEGSPGDPLFVYQSDNYAGINVFDLMPWFVDLDADGDYDLLAGTSAIPGPPGLKLFINQGTPQIPNFVLYSDDLVPGVFTQSSVILVPGTADIDADGDQDLFVSDVTGHFYYFQNTGDSARFQFQFMTNNWQNIFDAFAAHRHFCFYDIDQDEDQDLFYQGMRAEGNATIYSLRFYRNIGTPQAAQLILENDDLFPELEIRQAAPYLLDMDQDGDGDMFVGDIWGGIRYFKNVTGDTSAVGPPPVVRHPQAGLQISLGPNPANPFVVASFELRVASNMSLDIFDICGRKIAELASGFHLPGEYRYVWDASKNASGIYIIRLETPQESLAEKLTIVK